VVYSSGKVQEEIRRSGKTNARLNGTLDSSAFRS